MERRYSSVDSQSNPGTPGSLEDYSNRRPRSLRKINLEKNQTQGKPDHKLQVVTCLALHFGLIAAHIALFIVLSHHYEHRFVVDWTTRTADWLPTLVTTGSQL